MFVGPTSTQHYRVVSKEIDIMNTIDDLHIEILNTNVNQHNISYLCKQIKTINKPFKLIFLYC